MTHRISVHLSWLALVASAPLACGGHEEPAPPERAGTAPSPVTGAGDPTTGGPTDLGTAPPTAEVGTLPGSLNVNGAGSATYSIPFEVPRGPRGVAPKLGLSYSSSAGSGIAGVGFSLSGWSTIRRCPRTLADDGAIRPIELGEDDALCLDGQRLLPVRGDNGKDGTVYRPRVGNRVEVIEHGSLLSTGSWFEAHLPDGGVVHYGSVDESRVLQRIPGAPNDPAGGPPLAVREWWVRSTLDTYGHEVRFRYGYGVDGGTRVDFRPYKVEYGFVSGEATRWVGFGYEARPDPVHGFLRGAPTAMTTRLTLVQVNGPDGVVRNYKLHYSVAGEESVTGRSLLRSVEECTADDRCKPATELTWQTGELGYEDAPGAMPGDEVPLYNPNFPSMEVATYMALDGRRLALAPQPYAGDGRHLGLTRWQFWGPGTSTSWSSIDVEKPLVTPRKVWWDDIIDHLHYYEDGVNMAGAYAVHANNDEYTDVVEIVRKSDDVESYNGYGPFLGSEVRLLKGNGAAILGVLPGQEVELALGGSGEPLLHFVPIDLNGEGITDYVFCRADSGPPGWTQGCLTGYPGPGGGDGACDRVHRLPTGHWNVALADPEGEIIQTSGLGIPCDADDQLLVVDREGDGIQDLLVVPARTAGGTKKTPAEWGNYMAMRIDPQSGALLSWEDTGLPSDRFQRFMMGAMADTETGDAGFPGTESPLLDMSSTSGTNTNPLDPEHTGRIPFRSGGLGMHKVGDFNGDGLADIVRLELCVGDPDDDFAPKVCSDDVSQLEAIRHAADPNEGMVGWVKLAAFVWLNTGDGFVKDETAPIDAWYQHGASPGSFIANAAAFAAAVVMDTNGNGTADLLVPAADGSRWDANDYLLLKKQQLPAPHQIPMGIETGLGAHPFRPGPTMDLDRDGQHDVLVLQDVDGDYQLRAFTKKGAVADLLVGVRNGLGHDTLVDYAPLADPDVYQDDNVPAQFPTTRIQEGTRPVVKRVRSESVAEDQADEPHREVTYRYREARADRLGRGFLGFGQIESDEVYPARSVHRSSVTRYHDAVWSQALADYPSRPFVLWSVTRENGTDAAGDGALVLPSAHVTARYQTSGVVEHGGHRYTPFLSTETELPYVFATAFGQPCSVGQPCVLDDVEDLTPLGFSLHVLSDVDDYGFAGVEMFQDDVGLVSIERTYEHRPASWQLGLVRSETVTETLPGGTTTRSHEYEYDQHGALWQAFREKDSTDPAIYLRALYMHDAHGNPISVALFDLLNDFRFATMTWDAEGVFPLSKSNMLGHTTSFLAYDRGLGVATRVQDPNGETHVVQVDGFGRPIASQSFLGGAPLGPKTTTSYTLLPHDDDPLAHWYVEVSSTTEGSGSSIAVRDALGRMVFGRTQGLGGEYHSVRREYGFLGELTRQSLPYKQPQQIPDGWINYEYDGMGRPVHTVLPDGTDQQRRYGPLAAWTRDAKGTWSRVILDVRGRVARTLNGMPAPDHAPGAGDDPSELCFEYGAFDRIDATQPCAAQQAGYQGPAATTMTYDLLGRKIGMSSPEIGPSESTYDAWGQVVVFQDAVGLATGRQIETEYDVLGRPLRRKVTAGGSLVEQAEWEWDTLRLGALTSATGETGIRRDLAYDAMGRVESETHTVNGETFTFEYDYDPFGRLQTLTYPSPAGVQPLRAEYQYTPFGHLETVVDADTQAPFWTREEIDGAGRTTRERLGNDLVTTRTFDPLSGRLELIETRKDALLPVQWLSYDWEPDGHLHSRTDWVTGQVETYSYDAKDRLTGTETCTTQICQSELFTYDPWGALTYKSDVGAYAYTPQRRLSSAGSITFPDYDLNGNVLTRTDGDGTSEWEYTALNKPRHVTTTGGEVLDFEYDAEHRRVYRFAGSTQTETISLGLYEREREGSGIDQVVTHKMSVAAGGRIVAQVHRTEGPTAVTKRLYLHDDHLGTTDLVTGDEQGGVVPVIERLSFDAWGKKRNPTDWLQPLDTPAASGVTVGYTGHTERTDASLTHMRGRMYDPEVARFVQPDPFVQAPFDMRSHERYSYVWSSPATLTDPSGYFAGGDLQPLPPVDPFGPSPGDVEPGQGPNPCVYTGTCGDTSIPQDAGGSNSTAGAPAKTETQDRPAAPAAPVPVQTMAQGGAAGQAPASWDWMQPGEYAADDSAARDAARRAAREAELAVLWQWQKDVDAAYAREAAAREAELQRQQIERFGVHVVHPLAESLGPVADLATAVGLVPLATARLGASAGPFRLLAGLTGRAAGIANVVGGVSAPFAEAYNDDSTLLSKTSTAVSMTGAGLQIAVWLGNAGRLASLANPVGVAGGVLTFLVKMDQLEREAEADLPARMAERRRLREQAEANRARPGPTYPIVVTPPPVEYTPAGGDEVPLIEQWRGMVPVDE